MTARGGGSLSVLRHRDLRLLFLGQGISLFAASVLTLLAVPDIWRFRSREMRTTVT
jgi:hypothetical protein